MGIGLIQAISIGATPENIRGTRIANGRQWAKMVAMDIRHLKTLLAIADNGGFAAAGAVIGLTQSAVSLHVKALEETLGVVLFDRHRRPPVLNSHGRELVARSREIVERYERLRLDFRPDALRGVLHLGAVPTVITGILPTALAALRASQPALHIHVANGLSEELVERVSHGILDGALVSEPSRLASGLTWEPVAHEPLMVIAPAHLPGDDRTLLESLPFIRFQRYAWAGRLIDTQLRDRGIQVSTGMEMDSLEAISLMVSHGLGVSVVPRRPIREPFAPGIRAVPFGDPPVYRVVGLVARTKNPQEKLMEVLLRQLRRQLPD